MNLKFDTSPAEGWKFRILKIGEKQLSNIALTTNNNNNYNNYNKYKMINWERSENFS